MCSSDLVGTVLGAVKEGAAPRAEAKAEAPKPAPQAKAEAPKPAAAASPPPPPPSVRRIAEEEKLDVSQIAGSGKRGQVTKADALAALEAAKSVAKPAAPAPSIPRPQGAREERVTMSRLRKTIALRLKESQDIAAQLTTFNEADMTNVMALRAHYKDGFEKKHGVKLGFMSFFVKACIAALKEIPAINAEIDGDDIVYKNYYDIEIGRAHV